MRFSPSLAVAVLCAASLGVLHAQQETVTRVQPGTAKVPSDMSFAYDAQQGQIITSGVHLDTTKPKSNTVSATTGTIDVTLSIKATSKFVKGTSLRCTVTAIGGQFDLTNGLIQGAVETVHGWAKPVSGGGAVCTLSIPYSWTFVPDPAAAGGVILAYAVAAEEPTKDDHHEVVRSTLQVDGIEPLPPTGTTSTFGFEVVL